MQGIDYWRLSDELTIVQAALLICGYDPTDIQNEVKHSLKKAPQGYVAIKHALSSAVKGKFLPSRETKTFNDYNGEYYIDDDLALIDVTELKKWLLGKGIKKHFFFFPEEPEGEFLSSRHPRYSPKLAAAVRAWQAMDDEALHVKTPKQSIAKWLRLHATEYDLTDDDGKPMESAIEEIAKVANWKTKGGAPSTPSMAGSKKPKPNSKLNSSFEVLKEKKLPGSEFELDSDIPF